MIDNYTLTEDGVIKQVVKKPYTYGVEYSSTYDNLGELSNYMSYLRLGYILGTISSIYPNRIESLLDVGYGNGAFLSAASKYIPRCYGTDISNSYPLPGDCKFVDNILEYYDIITFFDALEHFNDIEFVKNLNCKYVCISLPWCHNISDEWFFSWKHRKPDEHLWHFNDKSLLAFMSRMGYSCINLSNIEDTIRNKKENESNILTGIFKKE